MCCVRACGCVCLCGGYSRENRTDYSRPVFWVVIPILRTPSTYAVQRSAHSPASCEQPIGSVMG